MCCDVRAYLLVAVRRCVVVLMLCVVLALWAKTRQHLQLPLTSTTTSTSTSAGSMHVVSVAQNASGNSVLVPDLSGYTANVLPDVARQVLARERQGRARKIISMSLYGDDPRYVRGALQNAELAAANWKGWTLRIYYGEGVPQAAMCKRGENLEAGNTGERGLGERQRVY